MRSTAPRSKSEFFERYVTGEFGNRPRIWKCLLDAQESGYKGLFSIRHMQPQLACVYDIAASNIENHRFIASVNRGEAVLGETLPDDKLSIQGNVWIDETGLRLEYSREPRLRHREAMMQPNMRNAGGVTASLLLKENLDPPSHDDLMELLERFPNAIIEFSSYRVNVGVLPNRRTIFWEVREGY